jgi:hypothetical protein
VALGDTAVVYNNGGVYTWVAVAAGEDLSAYAVPLYGSQTTFTYTTQVTPPVSIWRFDAVTSTELIDQAADVDPEDPLSRQELSDAAYKAERPARNIATWVESTCGLAMPDVIGLEGSVAPPTTLAP